MPATRYHQGLNDLDYEAKMQRAINGLSDGTYKHIKEAAAAKGVAQMTLTDRFKGKHQSWKAYSESQCNLTAVEEGVVKDWADQHAMQGHPLDTKELCAYATEVSGKTLGKNWPTRYAK